MPGPTCEVRSIPHRRRRGHDGHHQQPKLLDWVDHWTGIFQPDAVHWCDGSAEEYDRLAQTLVDGGAFDA